MPLSKEQRKALMVDQHEGSEPVDLEPAPVKAATPIIPAAPAAAPDTAALIQMLAAALNQNGATQAQAIKEALADATNMARTPIPENQVAPGVSVYSQPEGDAVKPRTKLRCKMYMGVYDGEGKTAPAFEYHEDTLTETERTLLNQIKPGAFMLRRADGGVARVIVSQQSDDAGQPTHITIALPEAWLASNQYHQMPPQVDDPEYGNRNGILEQLTREPATAAA